MIKIIAAVLFVLIPVVWGLLMVPVMNSIESLLQRSGRNTSGMEEFDNE